MKIIKLYNKDNIVVGETIIDKEDYDKVKVYSLHIQKVRDNYYRARTNTGIKLHHIIMGKPPEGMETDHINRNPLDNRKCNLRFTTRSQSGMNRTKRQNTTSIYKGVCWDKTNKIWKARIKLNGKRKNIGSFSNEIDAAEAYNKKALELFGEYAHINKIIKSREWMRSSIIKGRRIGN